MNRLFAAIGFLLIPSMVLAQTFTPLLNLEKPDAGDLNWDVAVNGNMDILDDAVLHTDNTALTSGRIPYVTTSGRVKDESTFTYTEASDLIGAGGVEFIESDTNPTCGVGNYNIYADLSETTVKICKNGTASAIPAVAGSDLQIQFNDGGAQGADTGFTWSKTPDTLSLPSTGEILTGDGSASVPSYSFLNATTTGFYRNASGIWVSIAGTAAHTFGNLFFNTEVTSSSAASHFIGNLGTGNAYIWMNAAPSGGDASMFLATTDISGLNGSEWQLYVDNSDADKLKMNIFTDPTTTEIFAATSTSWEFQTDVQLVASNDGVEFRESDTNPPCAAGDYNIYADLSETKLKKCVNGAVTDL